MATAKKQPSGQWKCRVYSHTTPDGKKHYRAFTASTKQEAEQQAARFSGKKDRERKTDLTVIDAVTGYIDARAGVLSPSTVLGYKKMLIYFERIGYKKINKLSPPEVQTWISDLASRLSPKSVHNVYGLFSATFALYQPDTVWRIKLPPKQKKRLTAASDEQIMLLYNSADDKLKKCIALAAFTSMRRGEICAIRYGDIKEKSIHVHADMVKGVDGWHYKPTPKTSESDRIAPVPEAVIELLGTGDPDAFVIDWVPDTITKRFIDLRDDLGLPDIRFHDLRHYYASIAAALIPDLYTESFGGWGRGSKAMREIYQNKIDPLEEYYANELMGHFDGLIKKV